MFHPASCYGHYMSIGVIEEKAFKPATTVVLQKYTYSHDYSVITVAAEMVFKPATTVLSFFILLLS